MDWYVVRHPEIGAGIIPETSLDHHRARGWARVSDAFSDLDREHVEVDLYRVDLDRHDSTDEPAVPAAAKTAKNREK